MSRRKALKTLIKSGAPTEEVEDMRKMLSHDGWEEFPLLPDGWRYKKKKHNLYITRNGDFIESNKDALIYMKNSS